MRIVIVAFLFCASLAWGQGSLETARTAYRAGEFAKAETHFKAAIAENPGLFDPLFEYGMLLLKVSRWAEAVDAFDRAVAVDASRPEPHLAAANAHLELGHPVSALAALVRGETASAQIPEYWVMRAGIEATLERKADASRSLDSARKANPGRADISYQVGVSYLVLLEDPKTAKAHLQAAYAAEPTNSQYVIALIDCHLQLSEWTEAKSVLNPALRSNPSDAELLAYATRTAASAPNLEAGLEFARGLAATGLQQEEVLVIEATVYTAHGQQQDALRLLNATLRMQPNHFDALVRRSATRLALADPDGALADARLAATERPSSPAAQKALYNSLAATGRKREAERTLRTWLAVSRTDPIPYSILGALLKERNAFLEAAAVYEALLAIRPNDSTALHEAAACHVSAGNAERAVELVEGGMERGIKTPDLFMRLALAQRQLAQTAESLATLREMRTEYPNDTRGWTFAAAIHESGGRLEQAIDVYRDLSAAHPNLPDGLDGAARCLAALGRPLEAAAAWRTLGERYDAAIPALIAAGRAYIDGGRRDTAEEMWTAVLAKRPEEPLLLSGYAQFLALDGRKPEAVAVFKKLTELQPRSSQPYLAAAELLMDLSRNAEAIELLETGIKHCYADHNFMRFFARVAAQTAQGDKFDRSIDLLFESKSYSKQSVSAWVDLRNKKGELAQAIKVLQAAVIHDSRVELWSGLARAHALNRDEAAALLALERAADADPTDIETLRIFAAAAEAASDSLRCATAFHRLATLVPDEVGNWLKAAAYYFEASELEKARQTIRAAARRHPEDADVLAALTRFGG